MSDMVKRIRLVIYIAARLGRRISMERIKRMLSRFSYDDLARIERALKEKRV